MRKSFGAWLTMAAALFLFGSAAGAATVDDVKARGHLKCGANGVVPGLSTIDDKGNWSGIDVDYCRALAAAVLGDKNKVQFTPLTAKDRFTALQSGEVDVLSRNTTWTLGRDSALGIDFVGVLIYDGQGFIVRKALGVKSAKELDGAAVCVNAGTTTELNLADYFRANKMSYKGVVYEKMDEVVAAYAAGRCDVFTSDRSQLAAQRPQFKNPADHVILPEVISKEPLGPAVRQDDPQWEDIARWTLNAMINAEEYGVTSENVDDKRKTAKDPNVKRLLGVEGDMGRRLGLDPDWGYRVIKQVGNYAEIYDRNLGPNTPIDLNRGVNKLWSDGGILYAPPVR